MCIALETAAIIGAITSTIASVSTSAAAAAQQADAQRESNRRSAEAAAKSASLQNAASNKKAAETATMLQREKFKTEKMTIKQQGANQAAFEGLQGGFLQDVSNSLSVSANDELNALAVQEMFAADSQLFSGAATSQGLTNNIAKLPFGYNATGDIVGGVVGGIGTGLRVGESIYDSELLPTSAEIADREGTG